MSEVVTRMRHWLDGSWSEGRTRLVLLPFSVKLVSGSSIGGPALSPPCKRVSSRFRHLKSEGGGAVASLRTLFIRRRGLSFEVSFFLSAASGRCSSVASLKRFINMRSLRSQRPSACLLFVRLLLLHATHEVRKTLPLESRHDHSWITHSGKGYTNKMEITPPKKNKTRTKTKRKNKQEIVSSLHPTFSHPGRPSVFMVPLMFVFLLNLGSLVSRVFFKLAKHKKQKI